MTTLNLVGMLIMMVGIMGGGMGGAMVRDEPALGALVIFFSIILAGVGGYLAVA